MPEKAVLISIRPKWAYMIFDGEKQVEVRKSKPRIELPFKCYVYMTYPKSGDWNDDAGKVIGEFTVDFFDEFTPLESGGIRFKRIRALYETKMHLNELTAYLGNKTGYGWHISSVKRYDKPIELSEFWEEAYRTWDCPQLQRVKKPPQSWQYVEKEESK